MFAAFPLKILTYRCCAHVWSLIGQKRRNGEGVWQASRDRSEGDAVPKRPRRASPSGGRTHRDSACIADRLTPARPISAFTPFLRVPFCVAETPLSNLAIEQVLNACDSRLITKTLVMMPLQVSMWFDMEE
jgi:hypothetical protein